MTWEVEPTLLDYEGTPGDPAPRPSRAIPHPRPRTGAAADPRGTVSPDLPKGEVEPDYISDTQPISEWHTLRRPPLEERDMWGATPLDQLWCRIQYRQAEYQGFYTPPTARLSAGIQYPGYNGGSDWGSVALDPERGSDRELQRYS